MNADTLTMLFNINYRVLEMNTGGLSHDESLQQPEPGGNCLNWVLGHIVASRNSMLKLAGEEPIWSEAAAAPYARGSDGLRDVSRARPLAEILADLRRAQERLLGRLGRMSDADLAAPVKDGTVGSQLAFLHFHEAYHAGQVGLLRRLLGKEGAIR